MYSVRSIFLFSETRSSSSLTAIKLRNVVIPTKVGIHIIQAIMDSCLRRNDAHLMAVRRVACTAGVSRRRSSRYATRWSL